MAADTFGLAGELLGGKYRVGKVLGEGGFGIVYSGEHTLLGQPIAIKCMKGVEEDPEHHAREVDFFLREARVLFSLAHPGIVRMYDVGTFRADRLELPYVVLERIDGVPLQVEIARRFRAGRTFSPDEILAFCVPFLSALGHAHASGVAHRDLKPSNILLQKDARGVPSQPKIVDFGIARWVDEMHRVSSASAFTPGYAAPEQSQRGAVTDARVDVFAAGLVIAEMCTLRPVIDAKSAAELHRQLKGERKIDFSARPDLPAALEGVVRRAVSLDPARRHANGSELLADVVSAFSAGANATPAGAHEDAADSSLRAWVDATAPLPPSHEPPWRDVTRPLGSSPSNAGLSQPPPLAEPVAPPTAPSAAQGSRPSVVPAVVPPSLATTRARPARRPVGIVAAIVLVAAAGIAVVVTLRRADGEIGGERAAVTSPAPSLTAAVDPPPAADLAPPPPDIAAARTVVPATSAPPPSTGTVATTRAKPPTVPRATPASTTPRKPSPATPTAPAPAPCRPFEIDEQGIRHYNKGCLGGR